MRRILKFLKRNPEHRQMLCVMMAWIMIKRYSCSIRGMVEECGARPGLCRKLGLDHVPSKSWLHKWMKRIPLDLLDSLLRLTAGSGARRTLSVDSTQYTFNRYVLVEDIKRGTFHRKDTVKHHALITADLKMVAVAVTDGNASDAPILAELCAKAPRGGGYLLGDSAYCTRKNCQLADGLGRRPCFRPKKGLWSAAWNSGAGCWPGAGTAPASSTGHMADETRSRAASPPSRTGSIPGSGP